MSKSIKELQEIMIKQVRQREFYPKDEKDVLLWLGEEVGELMKAVRKNKNKIDLSHEMADVLWCLLGLAELKDVDLEKAFIEKWQKNKKRPLNKKEATNSL